MPKSVWVSVTALVYLLVWKLYEIILFFPSLISFQAMAVSPNAWSEAQIQCGHFFGKLLMLGIGTLILKGLFKGNKLAWYASFFVIGILPGADGIYPARNLSLINLLFYFIPYLTIIGTLILPSARAHFKNKISWKRFLKLFGLNVAGVVFVVLLFEGIMFWILKNIPAGK